MMRTICILTALLCGTLLVAGDQTSQPSPATTPTQGFQVHDLRCEYLQDPDGLESLTPRLSWQVTSSERGQRQTAWRIQVASTAEALTRGQGDVWDSGRIESDQTVHIPYAGRALVSRQRCHWRVQAFDRDGRASAWSAAAQWSMGLLAPGDWRAQWISVTDATRVHRDTTTLFLPPARHYRSTFSITKPVTRAMLSVSALGVCEPWLNGQRVSDAFFEPGWSDYHKRAYYRTHDVTALMVPGANCVGAIVTDGWYAGYVGYALLCGYGPYRAGRCLYGKTPALLAQLDIDYTDGSHGTIGSGPSWTVTSGGPIREADFLMGETYDARLDVPDWCRPDSSVSGWEPAIRAEDGGSVSAPFHDNCGDRQVELGFQRPGRLQSYGAPPIRVIRELPAKHISARPAGVVIADLGENIAGTVRLTLKGAAGTVVTIRYGEMLHPDGHLMTENLRRARATDTYILRGDAAGETWVPRFTYHGFQYVEISGLAQAPSADDVVALVLHNDTPAVGEFSCADPLMDQLFANIRRTQFANFMEIPTDCPQRDERLGWMGDAQIYAGSATYVADVAAFFGKWLDDVEEAQLPTGPYPDYCPYPMGHGEPGKTFGTAWTDAGIICPWTIWQAYGDTRVIERHWASMTRFMDWRKRSAPDLRGVSIGNPWGDWLNLGETTPVPYIDAAYFAHDADLMAGMAARVGRSEEAQSYQKLRDGIINRFRMDYVTGEGALSVDTQTAYVLALAFRLLPEGQVHAACDRLVTRIAANGFRMATGFLGTKPLLPVLTACGHQDLALRLFQSRSFPSWGYEVANGATSIWERWDSYTKDDAFGRHNAAMNSFSHYSFGAVCEWMFRDLAGIAAERPGFARIHIHPGTTASGSNPDRVPIAWTTASYGSIHGRIESTWKRDGERFQLDVTIPTNTSATIDMPAADRASITESGHPLDGVAGISFGSLADGWATITVTSGSYHFMSRIAP